MLRQGPHHGAQKSTSSGKSLRSEWAAKFAAVSVTGVPENRLCLQRPQVPLRAAFGLPEPG